jgi:hypothetical protein
VVTAGRAFMDLRFGAPRINAALPALLLLLTNLATTPVQKLYQVLSALLPRNRIGLSLGIALNRMGGDSLGAPPRLRLVAAAQAHQREQDERQPFHARALLAAGLTAPGAYDNG